MSIEPSSRPASVALRSRPFSRPVRIATRSPARSASGAMVAKCWRARISVGAISAACAAGLDRARHGEQRHHRLAGADIALQQAQHALGLGEIGVDLGQRLFLRAGQRIGQRLANGVFDPRRRRSAAGPTAAARSRATSASDTCPARNSS